MVIFFCAILVTHKLLYTQVSLQLPLVFNKKKFMFWVEDLHEFGLD